jgi:hypothetical protein
MNLSVVAKLVLLIDSSLCVVIWGEPILSLSPLVGFMATCFHSNRFSDK